MRPGIALALPVLVACAPQQGPETSRDAGRQLFETNCVACHGATGTGDGPAAPSLATAPADLTRIAARRNGVWPVLEVMSIIDGYTRTTTPREGMPIIGSLSEGPSVAFDSGNGQVTQVPARLLAIADYLETLQSPAPVRYVP